MLFQARLPSLAEPAAASKEHVRAGGGVQCLRDSLPVERHSHPGEQLQPVCWETGSQCRLIQKGTTWNLMCQGR